MLRPLTPTPVLNAAGQHAPTTEPALAPVRFAPVHVAQAAPSTSGKGTSRSARSSSDSSESTDERLARKKKKKEKKEKKAKKQRQQEEVEEKNLLVFQCKWTGKKN